MSILILHEWKMLESNGNRAKSFSNLKVKGNGKMLEYSWNNSEPKKQDIKFKAANVFSRSTYSKYKVHSPPTIPPPHILPGLVGLQLISSFVCSTNKHHHLVMYLENVFKKNLIFLF